MSPAPARPAHAPGLRRTDLAWAAAGLLALLAWDFSGADVWLARHIAGPAGFPWRDAPLLVGLHQGGRVLAWLLLALLAWDAWKAWLMRLAGPPPGLRRAWLGVMVCSLLAVPALKRFSSTSCPWDVDAFGGSVPWVPHWALALVDGGPGHCFPSGHAAAAFGFVGLYYLWRPWRPALARTLLAGVLLLGAVHGGVQMLRGAHFLSHIGWTAWLCWAIALAATVPLQRAFGHQPPNRSSPPGRTGAARPRCRQAAAVATRPRGVR